MYLLDTDVVAALRRADRLDRKVSHWFARSPASGLYISSITLLEIERGALLRRHRDEQQGSLFIDWIRTQILPFFSGRIVAFDDAIAMRCAALHIPDPRPQHDSMIAATALERGMTVVTRNIRDFQPMGVPLFDPWVDA